MYKSCITEHSAKQQERFETCLMELLSTKAYNEITVSSLCEKVGLSRYTFYRLYDGKDDVLDAIVDKVLLNWTQQSARFTDPSDLFQGNCQYLTFWSQQKPLLEALCSNGKSALLVERTLECMVPEDPTIAQYFRVSQNGNSEERLLFCLHGVYGLLIHWHKTGYKKTVEEMANILTDLFLTQLLFPLE